MNFLNVWIFINCCRNLCYNGIDDDDVYAHASDDDL